MSDQQEKKPPTDADVKLKEVLSVWGPVEAEVIKSLLDSHGISCILKGLVVHSVHAFSADGLGEARIMVQERDYERAKKIITESRL